MAIFSSFVFFIIINKSGELFHHRYLLADRNVFSIPVAMTLLASFLSPITLLGDPAETYVNGGLYLAILFSNLLLFPTIALVFVPVFYPLGITSVYEVRIIFIF